MSEGDPIDLALREDIGGGDVTTTLLVPDDSRAYARILPQEKAIIAGTMTAAEVFRRVDPGLKISVELTDGTAVLGGETILKIQGAARSIQNPRSGPEHSYRRTGRLEFFAATFRHRDADP